MFKQHIAMKTITITDEAYMSLFALKDAGESFTRLVLRITSGLSRKQKPTLHRLLGALSGKECDALKREHVEFKRGFRARA
jgi:predicted CopG family antitoxin